MAVEKFHVKAVGVTFAEGYPENLTRLQPAVERAASAGKYVAARLVREPQNTHDANAIAVDVLEVGRIGHIPRVVAEWLAPFIDSGQRWDCDVAAVLINPDHPDRPGIDLVLRRQGANA